MAHFRAVIKGARGQASRLGHKNTGISILLQTWEWNVTVEGWHIGYDNMDYARIELVHSGTGERKLVGHFNLTTGERI